MTQTSLVNHFVSTFSVKGAIMKSYAAAGQMIPVCLLVLVCAASAQATVFTLQAQQQNTATHAWSFDPPNPLVDKTTQANNLTQTGTVGSIAAFNGEGLAADFNGSATGYYNTAPIGGANMTWEFLINPGTQTGEQHFLGTVQPGTNRFYAYDTGSTILWKRGDNSPQHNIVGGTSPIAYDVDHWYYIALQSSFNTSTNQYTVNAFARDLTLGGPFQQVVSNYVNTYTSAGGDGSSNFQIGRQGNGSASLFNGDLDALAFYDSLLSASALQANSNAVFFQVPEPSTGLLMLAGCGIFLRRRRTVQR